MRFHGQSGYGFRAKCVAASICLVALTARHDSLGRQTDDAPAKPKAATDLHGRLQDIGGLPVLSLWGTPRERGFAHGYLQAGEIHAMFLEFLADESFSGGPKNYEQRMRRSLNSPAIQFPKRIEEELRGIAAGMTEKLGKDGMILKPLKRALDVEDLRAAQALSDSPPNGCSSFAAWGKHSVDGKTIVGRNLDWRRVKPVMNHRLVIVNAPDSELGLAGWVSVTWPGSIGCFTGMNADGVVVCIHDVPEPAMRPEQPVTPRSLVLREAIESARRSTAFDDIAGVLKRHRILIATNVLAAAPSDAATPPAAVFEYDMPRGDAQTVIVRKAASMHEWQLCTNHFRARAKGEPVQDDTPGFCGRYDVLTERFGNLTRDARRIDPALAWTMLGQVSFNRGDSQRMVTVQSVVFEPDAGRMHVAYCDGQIQATKSKPVPLNARELIEKAK